MRVCRLFVLLVCFGAAACAAQGHAEVKSFKECVEAGNLMLKTFPGRCVTKSGQVFIDDSVKAPQKLCLDSCGDGKCDEIVCMGTDCPCAETHESCPKDCLG